MATGLLDYLEAIGETGATLGSGAAATMAGIPYGIMQNIRSGKYGTKEGVKLADKATQDFIKQYTYAPRGQMAQNALQSVAGLLESTKLPPVLPEAGLLAAIPRAAYASQFERAGMAAERAMEPVAANVMARGGLPAQLLTDLTQGTRSQMLPEKSINQMPQSKLEKANTSLPSDYYELNTMATQAYTNLRKNPSQETADYYKSIIKARDEAANNPSNSYTPPVPDVVSEGYKGQHQAPTKDGGAPLWDMKGIYPDDFYSPQGAQYYGDGANTARDSMIVRQMQSMKDRPNAPVTIYRSVPKSVPTKEALNTGDWITLDRQYAKEHGEGALNGDYKIVSKTVKARDLFTNGDSIYEMGYDPQPRVKKTTQGLLD